MEFKRTRKESLQGHCSKVKNYGETKKYKQRLKSLYFEFLKTNREEQRTNRWIAHKKIAQTEI